MDSEDFIQVIAKPNQKRVQSKQPCTDLKEDDVSPGRKKEVNDSPIVQMCDQEINIAATPTKRHMYGEQRKLSMAYGHCCLTFWI